MQNLFQGFNLIYIKLWLCYFMKLDYISLQNPNWNH